MGSRNSSFQQPSRDSNHNAKPRTVVDADGWATKMPAGKVSTSSLGGKQRTTPHNTKTKAAKDQVNPTKKDPSTKAFVKNAWGTSDGGEKAEKEKSVTFEEALEGLKKGMKSYVADLEETGGNAEEAMKLTVEEKLSKFRASRR